MPPIVVRGIGLRTPLGSDPQSLLEALCAGRTAFAPYEAFREAAIRNPIAAAVDDLVLMDSGSCAADDRGARMMESAVRDALFDAGGARDLTALLPAEPSRIALVAGTSSSGIGPFCASLASGAPRVRDDARYGSATALVARALGIAGPVLTTCNVCASGALAIAEAAELLAAGIVDAAIAVGFDPLEHFVAAGFDALGALVAQPRPFRTGRRGFILGEGAAALVLTRSVGPPLSCHGAVIGWGSSSDAHHITAPHPEGEGLVLAMKRALRRAALPIEAVDVINAHGTGTVFNDAAEAIAIGRVFGERASQIPLYTVKGAIGHTLGAAGAIEAAVSFAAMNAGVVPPTVTHGEPDPDCRVDLVSGEPRWIATRRTLSLSAGFGGTNCALLLASRSVVEAPR